MTTPSPGNAPGMSNAKVWETEMLTILLKLPDIERLIFLAGLRALGQGQITADQLDAWVNEKVARHRRGEAVYLEELEFGQ